VHTPRVPRSSTIRARRAAQPPPRHAAKGLNEIDTTQDTIAVRGQSSCWLQRKTGLFCRLSFRDVSVRILCGGPHTRTKLCSQDLSLAARKVMCAFVRGGEYAHTRSKEKRSTQPGNYERIHALSSCIAMLSLTCCSNRAPSMKDEPLLMCMCERAKVRARNTHTHTHMQK
jgi:hypothetical protein